MSAVITCSVLSNGLNFEHLEMRKSNLKHRCLMNEYLLLMFAVKFVYTWGTVRVLHFTNIPFHAIVWIKLKATRTTWLYNNYRVQSIGLHNVHGGHNLLLKAFRETIT